MTTLEITQNKIINQAALKNRIAMWRLLNKKIVFTNGCFDILHRGHIEYLGQAHEQGDVLVIGVNSDASVRRIKGEGRPVQDEQSRALLLASLRFVEAVVLFDEDTPLELIKLIEPDVLVKGGDYTEETTIGADFVKANDGEVVIIPLVAGYSTTEILNSKF
jgi:D-glycero-beta-D-manno-heptose 1-phosphate adenylyltransferase